MAKNPGDLPMSYIPNASQFSPNTKEVKKRSFIISAVVAVI